MSNKGKMRVKGVQCPRCNEKIWSQFRHDFHYCTCGYTSVDGGRDYLKYGWGIQVSGQPTSVDWARIHAENQAIGKPKEVYLYVPRPRKPTKEEKEFQLLRLYNLLVEREKSNELSNKHKKTKPRNRTKLSGNLGSDEKRVLPVAAKKKQRRNKSRTV